MTTRNVNFEQIKKHVRTQYGDLTGVIQIDGHNNVSDLYQLCKDNQFNVDDKFIIGFGLGENTTDGIGRRDTVYCVVYYVLKEEYGDNYEAIEQTIRENGNLSLKRKSLLVPYTILYKYIKRFDFIVTSELTTYADNIEIEEEEY